MGVGGVAGRDHRGQLVVAEVGPDRSGLLGPLPEPGQPPAELGRPGELVGGGAGGDEVLEEGAEGGAGVVGFGPGLCLGDQVGHRQNQYGVDQLGLGPEMPVYGPGPDSGPGGDVVQRHLEAVLGERGAGGGHHLGPVGHGIGAGRPSRGRGRVRA
jgi:hypothetical protein